MNRSRKGLKYCKEVEKINDVLIKELLSCYLVLVFEVQLAHVFITTLFYYVSWFSIFSNAVITDGTRLQSDLSWTWGWYGLSSPSPCVAQCDWPWLPMAGSAAHFYCGSAQRHSVALLPAPVGQDLPVVRGCCQASTQELRDVNLRIAVSCMASSTGTMPGWSAWCWAFTLGSESHSHSLSSWHLITPAILN